jgi:hypothetical protein
MLADFRFPCRPRKLSRSISGSGAALPEFAPRQRLDSISGQVAEWFKALDSKSQNANYQRFAPFFRALQVAEFQGDCPRKLV